MDIFKFPRTGHLEGSRYQIGDDLADIPFCDISGKFMVVEEKVDGSNSAISFSDEGKLLLQSRGHYLTGGPREKHFDLFKSWAYTNMSPLRDLLSDRYVMYGEWMYAKHTVYYNNLSHYFIEFDIYDKKQNVFLSTDKRKALLKNYSFISSAPILYEGKISDYDFLLDLMDRSHFIEGNHIEELIEENESSKEYILKETDKSDLMEGLYIKIEEDGVAQSRCKYVRSSFLATVNDSESHWLNRPIIKNKLSTTL